MCLQRAVAFLVFLVYCMQVLYRELFLRKLLFLLVSLYCELFERLVGDSKREVSQALVLNRVLGNSTLCAVTHRAIEKRYFCIDLTLRF